MTFGKSKIEKIKDLLKDLSEEERAEILKLLNGDEPEEAEEEAEVPAEEETSEEVVEEGETEEPAGEEGAPEEETTEEVEETETEEETPAPEEAPAEETEEPGEAPVEEQPPVEEPPVEEAPVDPTAETIKQLQSQVQLLTDTMNNLTAKVEPILQKFAEVDADQSGAGMEKPNSVNESTDADLSAHELGLKLAKY